MNPVSSSATDLVVATPATRVPWPRVVAVAVVATAIDFAAAAGYWSGDGVTPAQVLRTVASWVLGPRPPIAAWVPVVGAGVYLLIYLAMAATWARLVAERAPARAGLATGALYGVAAYVIVYQLLVPLLTLPSAPDRSPAWIATCVAVHALAIGPLMASTLVASAGPLRNRGRR